MTTMNGFQRVLVSATFGVAVVLPGCGGTQSRPPEGGWASASRAATVVAVTAKKWEYSPSAIHLKKDVPVVIEVTSEDVHHGFNLPEFGVRADALPGRVSRLSFTPTKTGTFGFHCDYFCGDGHEEMEGQVIVE